MTDITDKFISSIAQALNAAEVPCVLWGHCLLRVHGVPTIVAVSLCIQTAQIIVLSSISLWILLFQTTVSRLLQRPLPNRRCFRPAQIWRRASPAHRTDTRRLLHCICTSMVLRLQSACTLSPKRYGSSRDSICLSRQTHSTVRSNCRSISAWHRIERPCLLGDPVEDLV